MRRFDADALAEILRADFERAGGARLAVAYSGGRDSTVLLHALTALRGAHGFALRALHFDHGLAAQSADWAAHCRAQCRAWAVEFAATREALDKPPGASLEAHARRARYRWFAHTVAPGETLLTAHHADDQAETVLLNLLRGRGPESLAGIAARRALSAANGTQVARPLLAFPAAALADYARAHDLRWVDDPSNDSPAFDRNYLRAAVMPALRRRWPGATGAVGLSAAHCREAAELLEADDARCFAACRADAKRGVFCLAPPLEVEAVRALGQARARRLIRHWIHRHGRRTPSAGQLAELCAQVFESRGGALRWDGAEIRRFRGHLYLIGAPGDPRPAPVDWDLQPLDLGNGLRVEVETVGCGGDGGGGGSGDSGVGGADADDSGVDGVGDNGVGVDGGVAGDIAAAIDPRRLRGKRVQWAWRRGGERMTLPGRAHSHALKKLFQQVAAPPWERQALPLLTADNEIAWAHPIGAAANCAHAKTTAGIRPRFIAAGCD